MPPLVSTALLNLPVDSSLMSQTFFSLLPAMAFGLLAGLGLLLKQRPFQPARVVAHSRRSTSPMRDSLHKH